MIERGRERERDRDKKKTKGYENYFRRLSKKQVKKDKVGKALPTVKRSKKRNRKLL